MKPLALSFWVWCLVTGGVGTAIAYGGAYAVGGAAIGGGAGLVLGAVHSKHRCY
jgi:hypothetical protein